MSTITERYDTSSPEADVAIDLVKRSVWLAPTLVAVSGLIWGLDGAASAGVGVALVVVNFLASAAMLTWAGRISVAFVLGVAMFGYLFRLGLITVAVLAIKDLAWVELVPLGLTLIITHLGLLLWETKYVSASLAFPGLKPAPDLETSKE
ncbi:MAG: ATP synthase subunit I [Acidimicrobiales bacterium]|nr:ATP synthase subunit I [Acidimicrobiales bacterium]